MKWLEVRRHSLTVKGRAMLGSALSREGVRLARSVGADQPAFARVVTSASPRAVETAVAMGFAVDLAVHMRSCYLSGVVDHHEQWTWSDPYREYGLRLAASQEFADAVSAQRSLWLDAVSPIADGSHAMVVSHGGSIEPTLVLALPQFDHNDWGPPFSHCDGVILGFDAGEFVNVEFRRAPTA